MSEMVEGVAKALHRAHYERGRRLYPDGAWDALDRFERENWLFSARAALEEMRPLLDRIARDRWTGTREGAREVGELYVAGFNAACAAHRSMIDADLAPPSV